MEPKQIIESILDVYNLNATEFAEKIDVQRSGVSHIMTGRNKPSLEFLIKIKNAFPQLRWEFLIQGKLPMYVTDEKNPEKDLRNEISEHKKSVEIAPTLFDLPENEENLKENTIHKKSKPLKIIDKIVIFYKDGTFKSYHESTLE